MDLGSEISKQIKSAIKNKLQELGSYVDDELPEYIMVMLSNKRGKKQMTEDLTLFLGENTVKFIDWLTNLVEKLKDVASLVDSPQESAVVSDQQEIPNITPEKEPPPSRNDGREQIIKKNGSSRDKRKSPVRQTTRDGHHPKSTKSVSIRSERSKGILTSTRRQNTSESKHSSNKKQKLSESDEEEYQVNTPLSSVVKVQEKRPTLPPSKQATGFLLRKAVAEAHMSVTVNKAVHSLTYDPTSPPSPKKLQLSLEEKKQQKELLLQQHRELQKQLQTKELEDSSSNQEQSENDCYEPKEREDADSEQTTQEKVKVDSDLINEPVIELQVSEAEAEELNAELVQGDTRIVAFADNQPSSTTEEDKHKRKRKRAVKSRDRPRSPKFIVTLDGVDSELENKFEKRSKTKQKPKKSQSDFDDYVEIDTSNMSFAPQSEIIADNKPTPPAVEEVMFTLDAASDDEDGQQLAVGGQPQEKCKFWPDCMNGPNCPYYHPSTPCRTFPNCKFADKCLFIHPLCKFDGRCANTLCPFLHKNRLKVKPPPVIKPKPPPPASVLQIDEALPVLAQITPCKFFPGCTRSNCPFLHPKPNISKVCRYGSTCSRADCMFTHPPSKAALKWVAPSTHISERSFALPEDKVTKTPVAS